MMAELEAPAAAAAATAAKEKLVVVGSRLILEIVPWRVVPPTTLVTLATSPGATCGREASGTASVISMAPLPMMTAASVALACWPTTKGIEATLPAIGLVMVAWFSWSCAWVRAMSSVWMAAWSVINVAAVTVPPVPLRESPAAAADCSAELVDDSADDWLLAAAAPLLAAADWAAWPCLASAAAC